MRKALAYCCIEGYLDDPVRFLRREVLYLIALEYSLSIKNLNFSPEI